MDSTLQQIIYEYTRLQVVIEQLQAALKKAGEENAGLVRERDEMCRTLTDATAQLAALLEERSEQAALVKEAP